MNGRKLPGFSYANVVATLALFVALGGGAYAAFDLPRNSVRSRNIVNGQVKKVDLARRAVTSAKFAAKAAAPRARLADRAASADRADRAVQADSATIAANAALLGGHAADDFLAEPHAPKVARDAGSSSLPGFGESCHPPGGPSVSVTVGSSGLVAVYVSATISLGGSGNNGSVELFEPTDFPGCERILHLNGIEATVATRNSVPGSSSGSPDAGGWVILEATPGVRTYSLRMSGSGTTSTEDRLLALMPL